VTGICNLQFAIYNWSVGQQDLQDWQDKIIDPIGCTRFEGMTHAKTQNRKGKSATLHHAIKNLAFLAAWREMRWPSASCKFCPKRQWVTASEDSLTVSGFRVRMNPG
jgi:hypothetical protein